MKLLVLSLFLSSLTLLSVRAEKITALTYFPKKGTFQLSPDFRYYSRSYELKNRDTSSSSTNEITSKENYIDIDLSVGLFERLEIGGEFAYLISKSTTNKSITLGQTTKLKASGFTDPLFYGRFRFLTEDDVGLAVDAKLFFSPSFSNSKEATSAIDGNGMRGGHAFGGSLAAGANFDSMAWRAKFTILFKGSETFESAVSSVESGSNDSRIDLLLDGYFQFIFTESVKMNVLFGWQHYGGHTYTSKANTSANIKYDSYNEFSFGGALSFEIFDDFLSFDGSLRYIAGGERNYTTNLQNLKEDDRSGFEGIIGGRIQF